MELTSESESLCRLSGFAPSFRSRAGHFRSTPIRQTLSETVVTSPPQPEVHNGDRFISARSNPANRGDQKKSLKLGVLDSSGRLSSMESIEHKKERLEPLLFGFIRKDATAHRRPYTFRTPGRSTPNAGRNGQQRPRSVRTSRCLLEHRRTRRRPSDRHHGRREVPRRRPGWQLLTRVTGPQPLQFQVSTLRFSIGV